MAFRGSRPDRTLDRRRPDALRRRGNAWVPGVEDLETRTLLDGSVSGSLLPIGTPATAALAPFSANDTTLSTSRRPDPAGPRGAGHGLG